MLHLTIYFTNNEILCLKTGSKSFVLTHYKTLLFRDLEKAMVIPSVHNILPRHGDVIINLETVGYRNQGLTFYNESTDTSVECYRDIDDYGSVPLIFTWPQYPIQYWTDIIDHNKLVNLKIKPEDVIYDDGIFTITSNNKTIKVKLCNGPLSLEGFKVLAFDSIRYNNYKVVVIELVIYENDIYEIGLY